MANFNRKITETNVVVGEVRFSYVHVFEPMVNTATGEQGKYSVCIVFPKSDKATMKMVTDAVDAATKKGQSSKFGGKIPPKLAQPLHDGDEERPDDENFTGMMYFNASSKNRPGVRIRENGSIREPMEDSEFYSGCWGAADVNFYPYDFAGKKGIAAGLNNVIKTRDDERLGGGQSADASFAYMGELDSSEEDDF